MRVALDAERVDRPGDHLVVAGEHAELDEVAVGELGAQGGERLVGDPAVVVQLVDRREDRPLPGRPLRPLQAVRGRPPRSAPRSAPPCAPSACGGRPRTGSPSGARRAGSRARCRRGAASRAASARPRRSSQRRKSPRWRPSVVNRFGGCVVPPTRPAIFTITRLTGPSSCGVAGGTRGIGRNPKPGDPGGPRCTPSRGGECGAQPCSPTLLAVVVAGTEGREPPRSPGLRREASRPGRRDRRGRLHGRRVDGRGSLPLRVRWRRRHAARRQRRGAPSADGQPRLAASPASTSAWATTRSTASPAVPGPVVVPSRRATRRGAAARRSRSASSAADAPIHVPGA